MAPLVASSSINNSTSLRDNQNSNRNAASSSSASQSAAEHQAKAQKYLINCRSIYSCIYCRTHLADHDELVSRSFQGNHGRAYLFNSVVNVTCGTAVQRELNTGSHAVADIYCENCETTLGWKYEKAYVDSQKYKEGKFIIELAHVVRENQHLELDKSQRVGSKASSSQSPPNLTNDSGYWSSPTSSTSSSSAVDIDEDLGSILCDGFSRGNQSSSYSSCSLSSSQHNKIRRSLYLDSTPYDWKYNEAKAPAATVATATGATDANNANTSSFASYTDKDTGNSKNYINKIGDNNNSNKDKQQLQQLHNKPSTSFSPSEPKPYHQSLKQKQQQQPQIDLATDECEHHKDGDDDDDQETQFKFEADRPDEKFDRLIDNDDEICDCSNEVMPGSSRTICSSNPKESFSLGEPYHATDRYNQIEQPKQSTSARSIYENNDNGSKSGENSIQFDDEEFFDCYTDHELTEFQEQKLKWLYGH